MSLLSSVDAYCERTDAGFWSEPVNAATNAAFVVAGVLLWHVIARLRASGASVPSSVRSLPWLLCLIGLGSFLFHTLATVWAGLADTLSILLFACVFLYAFLRHVAGVGTWIALMGAALFTLASYFTPGVLPAGLLNQSGAYCPVHRRPGGDRPVPARQGAAGLAGVPARHSGVLRLARPAHRRPAGLLGLPAGHPLSLAPVERGRPAAAVSRVGP